MIGTTEIVIIAGVVLVLFGASTLPKFARSIGKARAEFEKGAKEGKDETSEKADPNTHDDANDRNASKLSTFWTATTPFGDTGPHAYTGYSEGSSSATFAYTNGVAGNQNMTFTMKEDKKDTWFILRIVGTLDGTILQ